MTHFVIAGKPDCASFVHVAYVSAYLERNLPNFTYRKVQIKEGDWELWLSATNTEYGWNHTTSPIIWKEVARRGGKAILIGGISDFWEHCYDYYGLESRLPRSDLENLVEDNKQFFKAIDEEDRGIGSNTRIVTVIGVTYPLVCTFLPQLLQIKGLPLSRGLVLRLFDMDMTPGENMDYIVDMMDGLMYMNTCVYLVSNFEQALDNCDLFIDIQDYSQKENEDENCWYVRNMYSTLMIADHINKYAKKTLKVVYANIGAPSCFNASLLCQNVTRIKLSNIIVVTADWGSCYLDVVSKECNIPLKDMGAPPVWGWYTALFVDVGSILQKSDIPRPYLRAIKSNGGSTLPLGRITSELRYIQYLTSERKDLYEKVQTAKATMKRTLKRLPTYAKVSATITALKIWFSNKPSDEIISLGILSNGTFGLPPGIVASQPVNFDGTSWVPFKDFPMQLHSKEKVAELIPAMQDLVGKYNMD